MREGVGLLAVALRVILYQSLPLMTCHAYRGGGLGSGREGG